MEIYKEEKFDLPHWYQSELTINHEFIEYKKNKIEIKQIEWVRWGSFASYINGIKMGTAHLIVVGNQKEKIKFEINDKLYGKSKKNMFDDILDIVYKIIVPEVGRKLFKKLNQDGFFYIGDIKFERKGLYLSKGGIISTKQIILVPYNNVQYEYGNGLLFVLSNLDKKLKEKISYRNTNNGVLLELIVRNLT